MKKIAFACDHRGFEVKKKILDFLNEKKYIETWLETPFEGGRHAGRVDPIRDYEQKHGS